MAADDKVLKIEEFTLDEIPLLKTIIELKKVFPENLAYTGRYEIKEDKINVEYYELPRITLNYENVTKNILLQLCNFFIILNKKNIVHGDIQDHNIIIYNNNPVIIDWKDTFNLITEYNLLTIYEKIIDVEDMDNLFSTFGIIIDELSKQFLEKCKDLETIYKDGLEGNKEKLQLFIKNFKIILQKWKLDSYMKINSILENILQKYLHKITEIKNEVFYIKYLKYKNKYLQLKN